MLVTGVRYLFRILLVSLLVLVALAVVVVLVLGDWTATFPQALSGALIIGMIVSLMVAASGGATRRASLRYRIERARSAGGELVFGVLFAFLFLALAILVQLFVLLGVSLLALLVSVLMIALGIDSRQRRAMGVRGQASPPRQ